MSGSLTQLIDAENKAERLFQEIENRNIIQSGKTEKEINNEIYSLAFDLFGIKKYWHKRIVRSGVNTLFPYDENPKNLLVEEDDILFIDFGPIFEEWEADYGRTYVIGQDPLKQRLVIDIEKAWHNANIFYHSQKDISGKKLYSYCCNLAKEMGWEFGGSIAGHLIGHFPHEKLEKEDKTNYIHPKNQINMNAPDRNGNVRHWILEIHFVDRKLKIGGFFEQLLIKK
tara:strand:- start:9 stop:689 length:681 start_codon:yes stop_codon:yes gene_type:complete